ncbi:MAG: hypothetical protein K2X47_04845, partial [Bdellovibrionales bacterium]|nr:hypothetical protein [Bdellovibrionales bacterium]
MTGLFQFLRSAKLLPLVLGGLLVSHSTLANSMGPGFCARAASEPAGFLSLTNVEVALYFKSSRPYFEDGNLVAV